MNAFPIDSYILTPNASEKEIEESKGVTLRDYFAAAALQGLMASGKFICDLNDDDGEIDGKWFTSHLDEYDDETGEKIHPNRRVFDFPEMAWKAADAILQARK